MSMIDHFKLLANYNQWMNSNLYTAAGQLDAEALAMDRGAFFGSILGTLNHILVGDTIWLKRFAAHPHCVNALSEVVDLPTPTSLEQIIFDDFASLAAHRRWLDQKIIDWIEDLSDGDLDFVIGYGNSKGVVSNKKYSSLILHFFNHQTHHRGQVSTLLSQAGINIGVTDLLALIPEETSSC